MKLMKTDVMDSGWPDTRSNNNFVDVGALGHHRRIAFVWSGKSIPDQNCIVAKFEQNLKLVLISTHRTDKSFT